jgi:hypothetical protein
MRALHEPAFGGAVGARLGYLAYQQRASTRAASQLIVLGPAINRPHEI